MAWLDKRGDIYRLVFQIGGQTFKRSLRTSDSREAEGMIALVERRIKMLQSKQMNSQESSSSDESKSSLSSLHLLIGVWGKWK